MNELMNTNVEVMISSREIAEATGKDHASVVVRDIKNMLEQLGINEICHPAKMQDDDFKGFLFKRKELNGRNVIDEILLNKELTMCLITGYDVKQRMRVIKRVKELEDAQRKPALPASVEVKQLKHELTLANKQLKFEERRKKAEDKLREQVFKDLTRLTKENEELRNNGEIQRLTKENEELRKQINPLVNDLLQIAIKENERLRNLIKTAYEGL